MEGALWPKCAEVCASVQLNLRCSADCAGGNDATDIRSRRHSPASSQKAKVSADDAMTP